MSAQTENISYLNLINDHSLESHVKETIDIACELAMKRIGTGDTNEALTAADLLRAVHIISPKLSDTSDAYKKITELLPLSADAFMWPVFTSESADKDENIPLSSGLAESYSIAKKYFAAQSTIWGRDFVSLALLAVHDSTLYDLCDMADITITVDELQQQWFDYVVSSSSHRSKDEWENWWRDAGAVVPSGSPPTEKMTYLFTWNPNEFPADRIKEYAQAVEQSGSAEMSWSTGSRRYVSVGDRVYLLRQGVEPRGLAGVGKIVGEAEQVDHYNEEKRKQGQRMWRAPVRWERLSTEPIVSRDHLIQETGVKDLWNTQAGGVKVRADIVEIIERLIREDEPAANILHYAQTLSDLDHENDWIGIRTDVEALSTLISVNRVLPPLSISIFGDWGSGKTFLMRKIQERVQILEDIGRKTEKSASENPDQPRYCSSILQIEFNSWHYTESNLWASLVNHIFEKLHQKFNPEDQKNKLTDEEINEFFMAFDTALAAREAADQKFQLVSAEVETAKTEVKNIQKSVNTAKSRLNVVLGCSVWDRLDSLLKDKANDDQFKEFKNALKEFGFKDSLKSARTLYETVERFRSANGSAREVLGSLFTTRMGVVGAICLAVFVGLITILAVNFQAPIISVGGAVAGILAWLAERANNAQKCLKTIQSFDQWLSQARQAEENRIRRLKARVQADLEQRLEALLAAKNQMIEAQLREARAEEDLKKLTARDQMRRFVDERVTGQTYAKHLGLISMIRKDFEELSIFMGSDRDPEQSRLAERISAKTRKAIPNIERIILYIDDLDRCQPERVVEVLEAIHLLLAFRLFVVVVAVDPRWVLESLRQRYPHLAKAGKTAKNNNHSETREATTENGHNDATAHDYLEKIFNIPFWVKPVSSPASKALIAGYLGIKETEQHKAHEESRFLDLQPRQTSQQAAVTERSIVVDSKSSSKKEKAGKAAAIKQTSQTESTHQIIERQMKERVRAEQKVENVAITEGEEKMILQVAPFLGDSPRRIKRYANTYRLLKSGLTQKEARDFVTKGEVSEECRLVIVFLAVITGAPTLAPAIFAKAFELRDRFDVDNLSHDAGLNGNTEHPSEAGNARGALELLKDITISRDKIERWIPCVMRYAFRLTPIDVTSPITAEEAEVARRRQ